MSEGQSKATAHCPQVWKLITKKKPKRGILWQQKKFTLHKVFGLNLILVLPKKKTFLLIKVIQLLSSASPKHQNVLMKIIVVER